MKVFSDKEVVRLIREGGRSLDTAIDFIYNRSGYKSSINKFVLNNSGQTADAEDVFQEGITRFVMNIRRGKFSETSSAKTYFIAICKNHWFDVLKKRSRISSVSLNKVGENIELEKPEKEEFKLADFLNKFLKAPCGKLLSLWSLGYSMPEIADEIGYKNANVVSKKKHGCMKILATTLSQNPSFKNQLRQRFN